MSRLGVVCGATVQCYECAFCESELRGRWLYVVRATPVGSDSCVRRCRRVCDDFVFLIDGGHIAVGGGAEVEDWATRYLW